MFRKILFPTDFSEFANKALEYVKKLKVAFTNVINFRPIPQISLGFFS